MPLQQCIDSHTHRDYTTWMAWFAMELNRPSRTDHYIMALTSEVRYLLSKRHPTGLEEFKLSFAQVKQAEVASGGNRDRAGRAAAKQRWMGMLGFKGEELGLNNGDRD